MFGRRGGAFPCPLDRNCMIVIVYLGNGHLKSWWKYKRDFLDKNGKRPLLWTKFLETKLVSSTLKFSATKLKLNCSSDPRNQDWSYWYPRKSASVGMVIKFLLLKNKQTENENKQTDQRTTIEPGKDWSKLIYFFSYCIFLVLLEEKWLRKDA